jgi:GT2 family glycosyltransferase
MIECATDTAVVILSYNGKPYHEQFLPLIAKEGEGKYDTIVIDNASKDDTADYVKNNYPSVKLLQLPVNLGFTGGYMEGLKHIKSKYIVLLSADFEVTEGWFEPLHRLMESDEKIAACQPKIRYQKQRELFEYAGAAGGFIDTMGYPFCRGRIFFTLEEDLGQYNDTVECFWASGGCFFTRSELFHTFGGFDPDFFAHMEEIDLCWRYKNAGYKIMACGESTVFHVGGSVITYGSPEKAYRNYRNNLIMMTKNLPFWTMLWKVSARMWLDAIAAWRAILSFKFNEYYPIAKAHIHFFNGCLNGKWFKKRKQANQYTVAPPNITGIYGRSMVWDYFIKGKKKFTDLGNF